MKKTILILAMSLLIGTMTTSCKKETVKPMVEVTEQVANPFTGVVFSHKNDSVSFYEYGIKLATPPNGVYIYPTNGQNGMSTNSYDSIPINFISGTYVHVGAGVFSLNEPFIETTNPNFMVRTKVYFNGVKVLDTASVNGQYWLTLP